MTTLARVVSALVVAVLVLTGAAALAAAGRDDATGDRTPVVEQASERLREPRRAGHPECLTGQTEHDRIRERMLDRTLDRERARDRARDDECVPPAGDRGGRVTPNVTPGPGAATRAEAQRDAAATAALRHRDREHAHGAPCRGQCDREPRHHDGR